ncbi:Threonylcarbamoyl-AMP synthase [uncultured spirochete]|uniref:Threonylcarbamoyl-AMP synthase n=1 Tax=uncultured spirochete TaxID=156406 RepID=A0A3P3XSF6_9SPIR|nr:Threonylcarbamoyl-AMP synthase [uncultured spirochete]
MEILSTNDADLARAAQALREGKLVAIPTETVYGLGANAFDEVAVARVFEAKARPTFDPLIVHIARIEDIGLVAREVPESARSLARALWPGPLTMILPKKSEVPDIVTAGLPTVAVRFPKHPIAQRIIELAGVPVAAPSANPFGYISPTTAAHVISMLNGKVDFIVDGGPCDVGVESTVIDMTGARPVLLRPGGMPLEAIEAVVGPAVIPPRILHPAGEALSSPGQTLSHYAPSTPLYLFEANSLPAAALATGIVHPSVALVYTPARAREIEALHVFDEIEVLAPCGDMREAAARLFSLLHEFDARQFRAIYAERVPEVGLGRAINDRLYRASKK